MGIIRANLDYDEEVHHLGISREWSNMIGYKMSSSLAEVSTKAMTSPVENFKQGLWNNDMTTNMATLLLGSSPEIKFVG